MHSYHQKKDAIPADILSTLTGVIFEMLVFSFVCSSGVKPNITQITRPSCCISATCFALIKPEKACFK